MIGTGIKKGTGKAYSVKRMEINTCVIIIFKKTNLHHSPSPESVIDLTDGHSKFQQKNGTEVPFYTFKVVISTVGWYLK
ncbi:hypothetical protein BBI00_06340 [Chryseobacterium arthrosphaerae]|uniref:Uncharacterized protein n=1 Tax=Chryseobacterium arthrosphaerae TaxID=651561 RepID=A0A1B8ZQV8_9FLAO|nr:hypothetical protein BBI00_06340 [Chryseobacterium arthrosphaerae]